MNSKQSVLFKLPKRKVNYYMDKAKGDVELAEHLAQEDIDWEDTCDILSHFSDKRN